MNVAVIVVTVLDALIFGTFAVRYARRRWWRSDTGRILMTAFAPLAALFAMRAISLTLFTFPDWAWLIGYGLLGAAGIGMNWLLRDVRQENGHNELRPKE